MSVCFYLFFTGILLIIICCYVPKKVMLYIFHCYFLPLIQNTIDLRKMVSCRGCADIVIKDQNSSMNALYCDTCWEERVCHGCLKYYPDINDIGKYCDCGKYVFAECGCLAVCWCQSTQGICRKCVSNEVLTCDKCYTFFTISHDRVIVKDDECMCNHCHNDSLNVRVVEQNGSKTSKPSHQPHAQTSDKNS